MHNLDSYLEVF